MLSELLKDFLPVDVSRMRARDFLGKQNEIENTKLKAIEKGSGWKDGGILPSMRFHAEGNGIQEAWCRTGRMP